MEIQYSLRLPRDAVTVPLVRTICRDAMRRLGVTEDCQGDVALALTEACANVVRHAAGVSDYEVLVEFVSSTCHIRVVDRGAGIDLRGIDLRDSDGIDAEIDRDSGRGVVLMRVLTDRLDFDSRPEEGTIVHLQKHLELEEGALLAAL